MEDKEQWDGLTFPNGLPEKGQIVEVKTCWSNGKWELKAFCGYIGFSSYSNTERFYDWFSVYGKPDVPNGSNPIVLEWRELS